MTQTVSIINAESSVQSRVLPKDTSKDFLGGINSQHIPNTNRFLQKKLNNSFVKVEKELDKELLEYFQGQNLKLASIKVYHNSPFLKKCLSVQKYKECNGFTLAVFTFENGSKLFTFSICSKNDMFSRLEGRVYTKRKALNDLRTKGLDGLYSYPEPSVKLEQPPKLTPNKIGNWIVRNFIAKPKVKAVIEEVNPLAFKNEDQLLIKAKKTLIEQFNLDPESIKLYTQYIRFYETSHFKYLLATPAFYKDLKDESKDLISCGGYTVYGIVGINKDTHEKNVYVTISTCSLQESFTKSFGRKQCLINFAKKDFNVYFMSAPVHNMSEALIKLTETYIENVINVDMSVTENTQQTT